MYLNRRNPKNPNKKEIKQLIKIVLKSLTSPFFYLKRETTGGMTSHGYPSFWARKGYGEFYPARGHSQVDSLTQSIEPRTSHIFFLFKGEP